MSYLVRIQDLPRLGLTPKLGRPPVTCFDNPVDCWQFSTGEPYYWGGYSGGGGGVIPSGGNTVTNSAPVTCNCLHGTPYMENGVCKCCEGVLIGGSCTGGIKQPPPSAVCTMDAKICPDGSSVGRDPSNNCEFFPCPNFQQVPALSGVIGFIKDHPHYAIAGGLVLAYVIFGSDKK